MLSLIFILLVLFVSLAVFLWVATSWLQGLIYNEPAADLHWRAPATAGVVTAFVAAWCLLDYRLYDPAELQLPLDTLFRFSASRTYQVDEFVAVRKLEAPDSPIEEIRYRRRVPGEREFVDEQGQPWRRADTSGIVTAIVIEENQKKVRFIPQVTRESMLQSTGFQEESGSRVMDPLGEIRVSSPGMWLVNIFFNLLHLGVWFACLWLLLRYQWHHALGLAVGLWLVMTLLPLPMVFDRMRDVARERAGTRSQASAAASCTNA